VRFIQTFSRHIFQQSVFDLQRDAPQLIERRALSQSDKYLEYAWKNEKDWTTTAKRQFKDLWAQYKPAQPAQSYPEAAARSSSPSRELKRKESTLMDEMNAWRYVLQIGRVTVTYDCLEMVTAACGSLRLPNLAVMYLVAHYTSIEHSVSSASIHYMTDTCSCAQHYAPKKKTKIMDQ